MERWRQQLQQLDRSGMRRSLRLVDGPQRARVRLAGREVVLLCSNNYLGLADHPALKEAIVRAVMEDGVGSGASRLVSGTMRAHCALEERLAAFKKTEAALVFNSGFAANSGILQALADADDVIFSDELNHASIIDGCRLARARVRVYPHRDTSALEAMLNEEQKQRRGRFIIVTDGVFSMDGDIAPLRELVLLRQRYDALLMVDDAHGTGVLGSGGRGTAEELGCMDGVDLHMGTLGKALGVFGAYLAAPRVVIDTLVNRCRPFIFSTSLPPAVCAAAMAALDLVDGDEGARRRRDLRRKTALFADSLRRSGLNLFDSQTQIVPVCIGDPEPTMRATEELLERGYFVQGIRPPTVPEGTCRLRATIMADHTDEDILGAAQAVTDVLRTGGND